MGVTDMKSDGKSRMIEFFGIACSLVTLNGVGCHRITGECIQVRTFFHKILRCAKPKNI